MGKPVKQAGRWFDKTMQSDAGWFINPLLKQGWDAAGKLKGPKAPGLPGAPPPPPDLTDKAVQAARRAEDFRTGSGSRRNSFITGPLGDQTQIPVMGKSVITGG